VVVAEEDAEHHRHGEDDLTVGDIEEGGLPHPFAPLLKALDVARWAKSTRVAGEHL